MAENVLEIVSEKFIQLSELDYSETQKIEQILNEAKNLMSQFPEIIPIRLLHLQTLLMLGKANEAMVAANNIWSKGGNIDDNSRSIFIGQLADLGLFEWAKILIDSIRKSEEFDFNLFFHPILATAIGLGDFELLEFLAANPQNIKYADLLDEFVQMQKIKQLDTLFTKQQKILNDVLKGRQTAYEIILDNDRGFAEFEVGVFVGGESLERQSLQDKINKDVDIFYHSNSKVPLNNFITSIFDIKSHWAG